MKKLAMVLMVLLLATGFVFANGTTEDAAPAADAGNKIKVGLLCIGDENDQGYSYNFIQGQKEATEILKAEGIDVEWVIKYNIGEDSTCLDANIEAAEEGCEIIFNNSFGFEPFMLEVAPEYPEIKFVGCTNCASAFDALPNTYNAFANIYEGRYVAGVVAGPGISYDVTEKITLQLDALIYYDMVSYMKIGEISKDPRYNNTLSITLGATYKL